MNDIQNWADFLTNIPMKKPKLKLGQAINPWDGVFYWQPIFTRLAGPYQDRIIYRALEDPDLKTFPDMSKAQIAAYLVNQSDRHAVARILTNLFKDPWDVYRKLYLICKQEFQDDNDILPIDVQAFAAMPYDLQQAFGRDIFTNTDQTYQLGMSYQKFQTAIYPETAWETIPKLDLCHKMNSVTPLTKRELFFWDSVIDLFVRLSHDDQDSVLRNVFGEDDNWYDFDEHWHNPNRHAIIDLAMEEVFCADYPNIRTVKFIFNQIQYYSIRNGFLPAEAQAFVTLPLEAQTKAIYNILTADPSFTDSKKAFELGVQHKTWAMQADRYQVYQEVMERYPNSLLRFNDAPLPLFNDGPVMAQEMKNPENSIH